MQPRSFYANCILTIGTPENMASYVLLRPGWVGEEGGGWIDRRLGALAVGVAASKLINGCCDKSVNAPECVTNARVAR